MGKKSLRITVHSPSSLLMKLKGCPACKYKMKNEKGVWKYWEKGGDKHVNKIKSEVLEKI